MGLIHHENAYLITHVLVGKIISFCSLELVSLNLKILTALMVGLFKELDHANQGIVFNRPFINHSEHIVFIEF
jgi:hypothetical protein